MTFTSREEAAEVLESLRMGLLGPLVRHFIRIGNKFLLPPFWNAMISRSATFL